MSVTILFYRLFSDSVLWPKDIDRQSTMSEVLAILKQFPFNRYVVKLSSVYEKAEIKEFVEVIPLDEYDSQLEQLFTGVRNSTSKTDLLYQLR